MLIAKLGQSSGRIGYLSAFAKPKLGFATASDELNACNSGVNKDLGNRRIGQQHRIRGTH